ncbi:MAG: ASKHA domain-containing protein, partial [Pseudomonadota bacterium]
MPSGKRGDFAYGTSVLDAARELGVYVESVCGGRGICGRCQVDVTTGQFAKHKITSAPENISEFGAKEQRYTDKRGDLKPGRRLSCSAMIQGDLVIDVPQDVAVNAQVVRKAAADRHIERDPATHLCYVEVEEPDMEKPLGDLDRLFVALETEWGITNIRPDAHLLPRIQGILRKGEWKVTCAVYDDGTGRGAELVDVWAGFHNEAYGLAVDIGSTTIAAHLISLLSGRVVASSGISNPQIRFGEDLMSRVSYVMMNPDGAEAMTGAVREALNEVAGKLAEEGGATRDDILECTFVANPVMHHLFLGIDPTELGGAPFALAASGALHLKATDIGLELNPGARAYVLPCIAGHVGADAAGVTLSEAPQNDDFISLVVDVGTNAEIVLGSAKRLVAASSPTGPAFEGAEISCGQRAAPGGIERLRIDPETLEPRFRAIGSDIWSDEEGFADSVADTGITGIVGSGIIEAIAEMFLAGILTTDGVIDGSLATKSDRIISHGRTFA